MNNEKKFIKLTPFKMQVLESFPFIDADFDAITNYELLCKVVEYLNITVDNVNLLNEKVEEFQTYFDNLDVQEEINNKLDKMVEDGTFQSIIFEKLCYVTYEMFGAKLDGITDDTEAIINTHNYANQHNLKVIQNRGIAYMPSSTINNCPIINTECDFTGLTFKFDNNSDDKTVMIIADGNTLVNNDVQNIELSSSQISYLDKTNVSTIPFLNDYKNNLICLETDMSLGNRNDPNDTNIQYYKQSFIVNEYGQLSPNNMYADISNSSQVTMRYLPLNQDYINIKFGKIIIDGNTNNNPRILIMRNNVNICNAIIEKTNYTSSTNWKQALFEVKYSANVKVENFTGNNPVSEISGQDITNYVITFNQCYNIYFINNKLLKGHGAISSYFCSYFTFKGNYINRFDNHYGCYGNYVIKDNNFVSYPCRINIGFGNANVIIDGCSFDKYEENNKSWLDSIILFRTDFGLLFSGNLKISNCKISGIRNTNNNEFITLIQYITPSNENVIYPIWGDYNMPKISVQNIKWVITNLQFRFFRIINNSTQNYNLKNIEINQNEHDTQSRSQLYLDNITIGNSKINLKNCDCQLYTSTNDINVNLYQNCLMYSSVSKININCYDNATINGLFKTVENNGILTIQNNSTLENLYNYNKCVCNGVICNNLRSSGYLSGSSITTPNGYISGILRPTTLINTGNLYLSGCYIELTNIDNENHNIVMTGCSMYSSQATKYQNNGTFNGYGNYAGANTNLINTYIPQ